MSLAERIAKAVQIELAKPPEVISGEAFESYIRKFTFPKKHYKLLHRTPNFEYNQEDFVESSLLPDFEFQCLKTGEEFYVEAKFRSGDNKYEGKIEWCKPSQLKRYQKVNRQQKVFIILGLGAEASNPERLILFPLSAGNFCGLYNSFLDKYSFPYLNKPVFSTFLWNLR